MNVINAWKMEHISYSHVSYILHLSCLLLHAQRCYRLVVGTVANKIQEIRRSKEDYHKDGIKLEK
jgi:hypothetical protein